MTFNRVGKTLFLTGSLAATCAQANNAEDSNKSNIAPGANLQDNYPPRLYDSNAHTNDVLPRATLPISSRPDPHNGYSNTHRSGRGQGLEVRQPHPQRLHRAAVDRKGDGLPQFTLYTGINVTFGK